MTYAGGRDGSRRRQTSPVSPDAALLRIGVTLQDGERDRALFLIMRVDVSGGTPSVLAAKVSPDAIAIDTAFVYWLSGDAAVMRVAMNGGDVTRVAPSGGSSRYLATDGTYVYWTDYASVGRAPADASACPVEIYHGDGLTNEPTGIVVADGDVFFTDHKANTVVKIAHANADLVSSTGCDGVTGADAGSP